MANVQQGLAVPSPEWVSFDGQEPSWINSSHHCPFCKSAVKRAAMGYRHDAEPELQLVSDVFLPGFRPGCAHVVVDATARASPCSNCWKGAGGRGCSALRAEAGACHGLGPPLVSRGEGECDV